MAKVFVGLSPIPQRSALATGQAGGVERKKVFVGLSGGVDSAVSAALLKQQGHSVVGCFIKIWQPEFIECTWREDRLDAMRVAAALGIPFREVDFSDEYKREVVDSMVADYARGITPNPDVLCNRAIKFGHFFKWAWAEGADSIATGHYARALYERLRKSFILKRGKDSNKDQSYFLWQLGEQELSRTLFPIGDLKKREVRVLARKLGLPNAGKPDSQGLCFVGDVSMDEFLARFISVTPGDVLDMAGRTIGTHKGAALYTVGQRHGFTTKTSSGEGAHYVVSVDIPTNAITVSPDRSDAAQKEVSMREVNWIGDEPSFPLEAMVQARYRETPVSANLHYDGKTMRVIFTDPHIVSPGQSLVVYLGERCLGGGVIQIVNS